MKMQNLHAMAEDMVRACLPYIDMRRQSSYALHNRTITGGTKGGREVKIRAKVGGREYITANCFMQSELLGQCDITTEYSGTRMSFICQVDGEEMLVMPRQGPDSHRERSLSLDDKRLRERYLPGVWYEWNIWHTGSDFAAFRQTWLVGEALRADSIKGLSGAIARYELARDVREETKRLSGETTKRLRETAEFSA